MRFQFISLSALTSLFTDCERWGRNSAELCVNQMSITLRIHRFTMDASVGLVTELTFWQHPCWRVAVPLNVCPRRFSFAHTLSHTDSMRLFCFPLLTPVLHFTRRRLIPHAICLYATFLWPLRALYKHGVAAARKICSRLSSFPSC